MSAFLVSNLGIMRVPEGLLDEFYQYYVEKFEGCLATNAQIAPYYNHGLLTASMPATLTRRVLWNRAHSSLEALLSGPEKRRSVLDAVLGTWELNAVDETRLIERPLDFAYARDLVWRRQLGEQATTTLAARFDIQGAMSKAHEVVETRIRDVDGSYAIHDTVTTTRERLLKHRASTHWSWNQMQHLYFLAVEILGTGEDARSRRAWMCWIELCAGDGDEPMGSLLRNARALAGA